MAKEEIQHYRAEGLNALIRAKYPAPGWTVLHELRDGTGFDTAGKRISSSLEVLPLCTAVMTGMTKEERAAYNPAAPCQFWKPEKAKPIVADTPIEARTRPRFG